MGVMLSERARALTRDATLPPEFAWVEWLSPSNLRIFGAEVSAALERGRSQAELALLLDEWKATAELDHAPEVRDHLARNADRQFESLDEWRARTRAS